MTLRTELLADGWHLTNMPVPPNVKEEVFAFGLKISETQDVVAGTSTLMADHGIYVNIESKSFQTTLDDIESINAWCSEIYDEYKDVVSKFIFSVASDAGKAEYVSMPYQSEYRKDADVAGKMLEKLERDKKGAE